MKTCPDCNRVACSCPPVQPAKEVITSPHTPTTKREAKLLYEQKHKCVSCVHAQVCEVGRHTAELYVQGWQIVIGDCSHFVELTEDP